MGDVKLAASVGLVLAWGSWSELFPGALAGALLGAVYARVLSARRGTADPVYLPLAPFLLDADLPRAVDPDAEAAEAITAVAMAAAADRWYIAQGWLGVRKPADAVRELLKAADPLPAWLRDAAATMGAMTGEDGLQGWHGTAGNAGGI